jgi:hypothetical protein
MHGLWKDIAAYMEGCQNDVVLSYISYTLVDDNPKLAMHFFLLILQ